MEKESEWVAVPLFLTACFVLLAAAASKAPATQSSQHLISHKAKIVLRNKVQTYHETRVPPS